MTKVTKIGQIDTKNQYGLKRKEFRHHYAVEGSLPQGKIHLGQTHSSTVTKPLQRSAQAQISFKGFDINSAKKIIKPAIRVIPLKHVSKVEKTLEQISSKQVEYYKKIKENYVKYILEHEDYRKENGITDELLRELKNGSLLSLPKKPILLKFAHQIASPIKALYSWGEKIILPKDSPKLKAKAERDKILKDFASLEGLIKSHEIWENVYRKTTGHPKFDKNSDFIIPDDVLLGKLNRRRNKVVDPNKGKYSSNSLMIGNRLISGIVYSYFLGTDAYNTTMRYSNDKHEASIQRKSRVAQEFSRIGLNMYIQNLLFGTFETAVNRSLPTAMFVSGSTVAFSEILGRKLVGKPIMPSDKETLDRLEKEMYEKKGILPSIGRLLTNAKKKEQNTSIKEISESASKKSYEKTQPNEKAFKAFSAAKNDSTEQTKQIPSFKGYYTVEKMFDKNKLKSILKALEAVDIQTAERTKETVFKALKKSEFFENNKISSAKNLDEILNNKDITLIPIGTQETLWGKVTKSFIVPVNFVKSLFNSITKGIKKIYGFISGQKNNPSLDKLSRLKNSKDSSDINKLEKFKNFYEKRIKEEAWANSNTADKEAKIFEEFLSLSQKDKEEIEGAKNMLLWLDKQIKKEKITINSDGTLSDKDIAKLEKILKDSVLRADGEKQLEYDGNTLAQTNINLSRAITTLFLVTDAYNLTMQYSNDNKKDANKSAKNRAAQEISRISVSAYIMAFVHNLLSKLCNSSLSGAFTLTALTSFINDSVSRNVVGVPLTAKTQEELEEIDQKNMKSKSPIKKALAYSIGKKNVAKVMQGAAIKQNSTESAQKEFLNDFYIKPEIN